MFHCLIPFLCVLVAVTNQTNKISSSTCVDYDQIHHIQLYLDSRLKINKIYLMIRWTWYHIHFESAGIWIDHVQQTFPLDLAATVNILTSKNYYLKTCFHIKSGSWGLRRLGLCFSRFFFLMFYNKSIESSRKKCGQESFHSIRK